MSPLGIALLAAAAVLVVAVEWPRIAHRTPRMRRGVELTRPARRRRPTRTRSRAKLAVVPPESEEFARSVERDLAALPTIDEHDVKRR